MNWELGIVEFVSRHFSNKAIEDAFNNDLTIGNVLSEADKEIEISEKRSSMKNDKSNPDPL
ncbi:MAG: hypothetical protein MTP17_02665 [Candidatus Midichloria sp.]|nr:MAG: hypothetical protein MTP17_02665 [Candidatus Midichloria sp.]